MEDLKMKKLMLSALALGAMTGVAIAGEPVKLTSSQLDVVSAGNPCSVNKSFSVGNVANCINSNLTTQVAAAVGGGGNVGVGANSQGNAVAANNNFTEQEIEGP
jgi:hypothetical protein